MKAQVSYKRLLFHTPSGTSRGVLKSKESWFLQLREGARQGLGELSTIINLSPDLSGDVAKQIELLASRINRESARIEFSDPIFNGYPALQFCYEMALKDFDTDGSHILYETDFLENAGLPINGLVWMGEKQFMQTQIKNLLNSGYRCIKLKIAAIEFEEELSLLKYIRNEFPESEVQIRVDANGGFHADKALEQLSRLSEYYLHSIEQPIAANQEDAMAELCDKSPLAIALDEELIGVKSAKEKKHILESIKPDYLIFKPSLNGGFKASEEYIALADELDIGWWVTSALESNIGLNAIAQWTSTLDSSMYQGLGTGKLFSNNIASPLYIEQGHLYYGTDSWGKIDF